jgi:D-glycero-D-manno-heptose 1,7-bisphosphate phosphatase
MINDRLKRFPVDVRRSMLVGDKLTDLEAARAARVRGYLFLGENLERFLSPLLHPKEL